MSAVAEQLRAARALIADPAHWCQGCDARDGSGRPCAANDPRARRWCAIGALYRVTGTDDLPAHCPALDALENAGSRRRLANLVDLNEGPGHAAVLALYDAAIADAEAGVRP